MSLEIGGVRYPLDKALIVGQTKADARHPEGTETCDYPCDFCGAALSIAAANFGLSMRNRMLVACLDCAYRHYPGMLCGTHAVDGHVVTLREAIEKGWIKLRASQ
jgi:hypothetical protein